MEPDLFAYSPILHRPKLSWPNGARVALWVVPNIEHYEYQPKFVRTREPWPRSPWPDVLGYSQRDYGNRVGLWRLFDTIDALGIRCTVSLSMAVIQHYPAILEAMESRRWELMSHGIYNTRYHLNLTPEEELTQMLESRDIHRRLTGREQAGWFSPAIMNTANTFDLAAEAGFAYTADLYHDDQPFPLKVKSGNLLSMPYSVDLNDVILHRRGEEAQEFATQIRDHFDTVYAEGAEQGRGDVHRAAPVLGRPAAPHPGVPARHGIHSIAFRRLGNHRPGDRRLVQRASAPGDPGALGIAGGGQWLTHSPLTSLACRAWTMRITRSAPCRRCRVSLGPTAAGLPSRSR